MAKKRKSLLILEKAKLNDALNGNISINRIASSYLLFSLLFLQHFCLFNNSEAQTQVLSFLSVMRLFLKVECYILLLLSNLATLNGFSRENQV